MPRVKQHKYIEAKTKSANKWQIKRKYSYNICKRKNNKWHIDQQLVENHAESPGRLIKYDNFKNIYDLF